MTRIQLEILGTDSLYHYYPIPDGQGWKVDPAIRCIVVGTGVPRTMIPLDNVRSWRIVDLDADKPKQQTTVHSLAYLWFHDGKYQVWDGIAGESFENLTDAAAYLLMAAK